MRSRLWTAAQRALPVAARPFGRPIWKVGLYRRGGLGRGGACHHRPAGRRSLGQRRSVRRSSRRGAAAFVGRSPSPSLASAASARGSIHYGPWFIAIGVWLALWELTTAKFGWLPKPFFSPPNGLLNVYVTEWPRLLICIGYTLRLWSLGFGLRRDRSAMCVGVALGWSKRFSLLGHADPQADRPGAGDRLDSLHLLLLPDDFRRERVHRRAVARAFRWRS